MSPAAPIDTEVLVVGGGPVGLALAGDLGWRGRPCVLLERTDGAIFQPKAAVSAPHSTRLMAQDCRLSFFQVHTGRPRRARRSFSRCQADLRLPNTVRGRNCQKVSPKRELAGSSGVATRTWWPRLCSMKKWP